jgi:AcrR family transcriptional regulator
MQLGSKGMNATSAVPRNRDARQVKTDRALRAALLALVQTRPLDEITVRDIVAEAGVGYATFFRHYHSKGALLDAIAAEEIEVLIGLASPLLNPEDTRATCLALARYVDEHRTIWTALLTGGAAGAMREQFSRFASTTTEWAVSESQWLPTDLGVIFGVAATVEILAWWLRQAPNYSVERIAEILDRLVITPTVGSLGQA